MKVPKYRTCSQPANDIIFQQFDLTTYIENDAICRLTLSNTRALNLFLFLLPTAELLCPFDKKERSYDSKNSIIKHTTTIQNNDDAEAESGNENATDMSDIEQETDEDFVKVFSLKIL